MMKMMMFLLCVPTDRKPPQFIGLPPVWNVTLTSSVFRQDISVTAEASNETLYPDVSVTVLSASLTLNYTFGSTEWFSFLNVCLLASIIGFV